ncbi:unnamed protein product [Rodentolepis nana]|uniref:DUF2769 domain-containing protein n=1 Tax=Rodentolepis nana TaxID=102285 RepID=A0A0R3SZZ4_RODNA|nr:unnamed protein product [Rodentolepis nana]
MCDCNKDCSRSTGNKVPVPTYKPMHRECKEQAPCDPMTRPCSPCRPCCKVTPAPTPKPPYEQKDPFAPCGSCDRVERFDRWSKTK